MVRLNQHLRNFTETNIKNQNLKSYVELQNDPIQFRLNKISKGLKQIQNEIGQTEKVSNLYRNSFIGLFTAVGIGFFVPYVKTYSGEER